MYPWRVERRWLNAVIPFLYLPTYEAALNADPIDCPLIGPHPTLAIT
jgi:hypothetical protein